MKKFLLALLCAFSIFTIKAQVPGYDASGPVAYETQPKRAFYTVRIPATPVDSPEFTTVIRAVHDGDSFFAFGARKSFRHMLYDAPEVRGGVITATQQFGQEMGDSVRLLLKGREVTYDLYGIDQYKRPLVIVYLNGVPLHEIVLAKGWAWYYPTGSSKVPREMRTRAKAIFEGARTMRIGIFADNDPSTPEYDAPIEPAEWRKKHRAKKEGIFRRRK